MQINKYTLPNGLRIIHQQLETTQMVAVNTLYLVGSRNEDPKHTGFAHLFEHLMFGGSVNIPNYDTPLQYASGDNNAFTDADFTNYYITIPSQNIETAFWLESDRMLSLAFSPQSLEVQRKVVMEEFKQNYLNQPYGDIGHIIFDMTYKQHPYRWPTIGLKLIHIADATMEEVKHFFKKFYRPDNAILSVVGNITWEKTLELVEKWYGSIPKGNIDMGKELITKEPKQIRQRRKIIRRNVPNSLIVMTFPIPPSKQPDFMVCDLLSDLLANGESSRMYRKLVLDRKLFVSIDASVLGRIDGSLFIVEAVMAPGADIDVCEEAIWKEIYDLRTSLPDEKELTKIKNKYETNHYVQNMNYLNRAQKLAHYEALGDVNLIEREVDLYSAINVSQIKDISTKYLKKSNSNVLRYIAK